MGSNSTLSISSCEGTIALDQAYFRKLSDKDSFIYSILAFIEQEKEHQSQYSVVYLLNGI